MDHAPAPAWWHHPIVIAAMTGAVGAMISAFEPSSRNRRLVRCRWSPLRSFWAINGWRSRRSSSSAMLMRAIQPTDGINCADAHIYETDCIKDEGAKNDEKHLSTCVVV